MQQSPFVSLAQGTEIATLQKLHCFMKHSSPSLAGHIQIQSNYDIPWLYQFLVNKAWLNAYFLLHFWWFLLKGRDMLHSCGSLAKPMGTSKRKLKIEQSASPNFYWSVFYKWPWIACTFMYTFNHLCIYCALMIDRNTLLHTKQTHRICIIMIMHTKKKHNHHDSTPPCQSNFQWRRDACRVLGGINFCLGWCELTKSKSSLNWMLKSSCQMAMLIFWVPENWGWNFKPWIFSSGDLTDRHHVQWQRIWIR